MKDSLKTANQNTTLLVTLSVKPEFINLYDCLSYGSIMGYNKLYKTLTKQYGYTIITETFQSTEIMIYIAPMFAAHIIQAKKVSRCFASL